MTWEDEGSPLSTNFEQCGFETTWFLRNSSTTIWIYCLQIVVFLVYLLIKAIYERCGRLQALQRTLAGYLFYNGIIRLFTETFLDLYVTSLLNIVAVDWKTSSAMTRASNVTAVGVFTLWNLAVLFLAVLYARNFDKINAKSNYSALLSGTKLDGERKTKWNLLLPAFLFGRRICFTLGVLLIRHFLWA